MLDTSAAIPIRDGAPGMRERGLALEGELLISVVTRVELENGVEREPGEASIRRARLNAFLEAIRSVPFDDEAAEIYGAIVAAAGYSRRKLLDRMIAAQALQHEATLVTLNPQDFSDVPGLVILAW